MSSSLSTKMLGAIAFQSPHEGDGNVIHEIVESRAGKSRDLLGFFFLRGSFVLRLDVVAIVYFKEVSGLRLYLTVSSLRPSLAFSY